MVVIKTTVKNDKAKQKKEKKIMTIENVSYKTNNKN